MVASLLSSRSLGTWFSELHLGVDETVAIGRVIVSWNVDVRSKGINDEIESNGFEISSLERFDSIRVQLARETISSLSSAQISFISN